MSITNSYKALDKMPVAGCLAADDSEHTLLYGNEHFYQLLGCSATEFQYRFGGRLSAVTVGDWPNFNTSQDGATIVIEHMLRLDRSAQKWVRISAKYSLVEEQGLIFCVLTDITKEKQAVRERENSQVIYEKASLLTGIEMFKYDLETRKADIYKGGIVLQVITPKEQERYESFENALLEMDMVAEEDKYAVTNVFESIRKGEGTWCDIRVHVGGRLRWMRLGMELIDDNEESAKAAGTFQNITELKTATLGYLGETQFLQAFLAEKDAYVKVDVTEDKVIRSGGLWFVYKDSSQESGYGRIMKEYAHKRIHPEDEEYYLELLCSGNLVHSFENGIERLNCRVREINEQNCVRRIMINIYLFRNPFSQNIEAIICMEGAAGSQTVPPESITSSAQQTMTGAGDTQTKLQFDQILAENGDIAYLVDMDNYMLLAGNEAFYCRLGLTQEECAGRACYEVLHHRNSPCPFCGRASWSRERFHIWKNWNAVFRQEYLIKNKIVALPDKEVLLAILVDVCNDGKLVDYLEDGGNEIYSVLGGIQKMSQTQSLDECIWSALGTIGGFYSAQAVQYWRYDQKNKNFYCDHEWKEKIDFLGEEEEQKFYYAVNQWVRKYSWVHPVVIENAEAMICHSYKLYELMVEVGIWNQRWEPVREGETLLGILVITNLSANFHNISFLGKFLPFMVEEWNNHRQMDEIAYASTHDLMTGFYNRSRFERYQREFRADEVTTLGVVAVNINDLDGINIRQGHQTGDECIRHFSSEFQSAFPEGMIYRISGSEFVAVLKNIVLEKLAARIEEMEDEVVSCRRYAISTGYAWDNMEKELKELFEEAVQRMRFNKQENYKMVNKSTGREWNKMSEELLLTLDNREFEVFLQPKVNLYTRKIMGAEALIRYRDKDDNIIPPSHFIDILEKNNLIRFIDFFVLEECCRILERWQKEGVQLPTISFNFSRLTLLERNVTASVLAIFNKYDIAKEHIEIEITESMAGMAKGNLYQAAHELYNAGFSLSLDDFGTKYTNLDILSELDFDMLKLDKSLVSLLPKRQSNQIILKNVITMCKHLNIGVIAEGIESETQEAILRALGCRYGQGYLYGRPMSVREFEEKFIIAGNPGFRQT